MYAIRIDQIDNQSCASNLDIPSSIAAEVMAVITAIEIAWVRDWKHIWLEVDSSLVLDYNALLHLCLGNFVFVG